MSASVKKVLIIGGGFSGMSAAIKLSEQGVETHLLEIDPDWQADGAGISVGGATLRALKDLDVLDEFLDQGSVQDALEILAPTGQLLQKIPNPPVAGADVPGGGAIMRPVLARIMSRIVLEAGKKVRLGYSYISIDQDYEGGNRYL